MVSCEGEGEGGRRAGLGGRAVSAHGRPARARRSRARQTERRGEAGTHEGQQHERYELGSRAWEECHAGHGRRGERGRDGVMGRVGGRRWPGRPTRLTFGPPVETPPRSSSSSAGRRRQRLERSLQTTWRELSARTGDARVGDGRDASMGECAGESARQGAASSARAKGRRPRAIDGVGRPLLGLREEQGRRDASQHPAGQRTSLQPTVARRRKTIALVPPRTRTENLVLRKDTP